ncbi:MAG: hypothetical protein A2521_07395 [Deltaproteobacteria bacterium RIFOXYD12_FULL_57_12]|nr:MAG: hypothetical protein A2521_07395 [Deltaproteobacteria bacterium RIFOXYD12_FULL_57_12]
MATPDLTEKPLYNSRIPLNYIRLLQHKYRYVDIDDLLNYAGMERHQIEDDCHWFTQTQINRFHERLQESVWNRNIAREAGIFTSSPESIGAVRNFFLSLVSPSHAYGMFAKYASRFSRSSVCTSRKLGPRKMEITATPNPGVQEQPFQCENRHGYIDALSRTFNVSYPYIEHPECVFRGGTCCRYVVSWSASLQELLHKGVVGTGIALPITFLLAFWFLPAAQVFTIFLPLALVFTLFLIICADRRAIRDLRASLENARSLADELYGQSDESYSFALLIKEIGEISASQKRTVDSLLENISAALAKHLPYDRGMILLPDPDGKLLCPKHWYGLTDEQIEKAAGYASFSLERGNRKGLLASSFFSQKPILIQNTASILEKLSPTSREFAKILDIKSFISCPIVFAGKSLGVLAVDNGNTGNSLRQRDVNLLMGVASQIGLGIHSALLEERFHSLQKSSLRMVKG